MRKRGNGAGLTFEMRERLRIGGQIGRQNVDRDVAPERLSHAR